MVSFEKDAPGSHSGDGEMSSGLSGRRGFSMLFQNGVPMIQGASINTNVLITTPVPSRGVVSSNPLRMERLVQSASDQGILKDVRIHTHGGWGIKVWTGTYRSIEMFLAIVPMGSTGAGFAFFELYAAGAQAIVRLGANDATKAGTELVLCHQADNLVSMRYASGIEDASRHDLIPASGALLHLLSERGKEHKYEVVKMTSHLVADYHAMNFAELFVDRDEIQARISQVEDYRMSREGCWDMESAVLFFRAQQFGHHAATVLVPCKSPLQIESDVYILVFEALLDFEASIPRIDSTSSFLSRASRRMSTNDMIGIEEPLFVAGDVETGNNLFNDDDSMVEGAIVF